MQEQGQVRRYLVYLDSVFGPAYKPYAHLLTIVRGPIVGNHSVSFEIVSHIYVPIFCKFESCIYEYNAFSL